MDGDRKVRVTPRTFEHDRTDGRVWGNYVDPKTVKDFRGELERTLRLMGYTPLAYRDDVGPDAFGAVAYVHSAYKDTTPFREEPILIDDGSCKLAGKDVFKVVIRDAEGKNRQLHDRVLMLMARFHIIEPNSIGSVDDCAEGTLVYALKRAYWQDTPSDSVH
ncbi:hypothetical protein KY360_05190 [Candidatus Woesearchaeota archaeon]|nr:hypothetical protein [Candidatus Woesearchaeota archaeon]